MHITKQVHLGILVDYSTIEDAVTKAANDFNWSMHLDDNPNSRHKITEKQEEQFYLWKTFNLKHLKFIPMIDLSLCQSGNNDYIYIHQHFAQSSDILKYISSVKTYLGMSKPEESALSSSLVQNEYLQNPGILSFPKSF